MAQGRLIWTDAAGDVVYELFPANGQKTIISRGLNVTGIALNRNAELIFAGATGLHVWRGQDDCHTILTEYDGETLIFNDIIADPEGAIYAGTCYWGSGGMEKPGRLYLINTDGSVRVVEEGIELSNGLGFSPDDRILYFADSAARKIYAYDIDPDTGDLLNKRIFATMPPDEGLPDGLTVDKEGYVWSAQWYGSQVVRYDPEGKVERRIPMPVTQVSSVAFGGSDLTDLYITTAAESWPSPLAPPGYNFNAPNTGGSLYRVRLDIQGKPEHRANIIG